MANLTPDNASPDAAAMVNAASRLDHEAGAGEETYTASDETKLRDRQPKGDHNRRLALGLEMDEFAAQAGVTADELREYEQTWPDHDFDLDVARRIGAGVAAAQDQVPLGGLVAARPVPDHHLGVRGGLAQHRPQPFRRGA